MASDLGEQKFIKKGIKLLNNMNYLDEIIEEIRTLEDSIFNFDNELEETMRKIENLEFMGQVEYNNLYMAMLHQVIEEKTGKIHTLTRDEAEEFNCCGKIEDWKGWKPFAWTFWFFNMDKNYVRALVSFDSDQNKRIKENYGILYNELRPDVVSKIPRKLVWEANTINTSYYPEIWRKLKEVIQFGKNHTITIGKFDEKIKYEEVKYFGNKPDAFNVEATLLDDEYRSTMKPEIIKLPVKHEPVNIEYDQKLLKILRGTSFKQIDFEGDGWIKDCESIKELNSWMYSIINYINSGRDLDIKLQEIKVLEKHYFSNKLGLENSEKYYKLKLTKFQEAIVIEAEVAEMGIYYRISNWNGVSFCDCV